MSANTLPFPGVANRKKAFERYLPADAPLPPNVVRFPWREAQARLNEQIIEAGRIKAAETAAAAFPELYKSPELALIIAIYTALPKKRRVLVTRSIRGLAQDKFKFGSEAPNVALDLLDRINAALISAPTTPPKRR